MNIDAFPTPVNPDPKLAKVLEAVIAALRRDDTRRLANPAQQANRRAQLAAQLNDPELADRQLERILRGNDLTDINYLAIGSGRARSAGRIVIRQNRRLLGYATGFLVAPGVLMTNQHVFETAGVVEESVVQFQYERNARGEELDPIEFGLRVDPSPIINKGLDFAVVAVEPASPAGRPLRAFGWLKLNPAPGKAFVGEYLTIIRPPGGQRKQICVRENKLLKYVDDTPFLWYQTDTVGGSSGSPAFNTTWDVVALHHKSFPRVVRRDGRDAWLARDGRPWTESMGDAAVDWIANEGVRVSKIIEYLRQSAPDHPLTRAVTSAGDAPVPGEALPGDDGPAGGVRLVRGRDGRIKVLVPVEIDLNMNVGLGAALAQVAPRVLPAPASAPVPNGRARVAGPVIVQEKVEIDTDNYDERNGYRPDFLGGGLVVPLPKVTSPKFGAALKVSGSKTELRYWNYSVVMNADRRLAFFSAGNLMPAERRGGQDGNQFIRDKRIDPDAQVGNEFYKKQDTFEADDRAANPFDQGHLSRREDLQWGASAREAKRNGDDSFHYTNCAPQHFAFNQNRQVSGLWNRLEVSAGEQLSAGERVIVINGPVFNAPASKAGPDGKLRLQLKGARKKDPTFGGVAIPKLFFKLIAYREGDALRAKAFVVSQEDMLDTVDRLHAAEASTLSDKELSLYQVKVKDLEELTGLKFGIPAAADTPHVEELARLEGGRPIDDGEELFL